MKKILCLLSATAILCIAIAVSTIGCGGGGGGDTAPQVAIPPAAVSMDTEMKSNMARFVPLVANVESNLVFLLNPDAPKAPGMTVALDNSPGTPPYTFTFSGPHDGNGDGINETTISGRATFNSNPAAEWSGVSGQASVDVSLPVLGHVYHSDVAFTILTDQRQISGSGTFTEPLTGKTTTMTVSASSPLVIRNADASAGSVSNACGLSLNGQMRLDFTGSDGTLTSYWNFNSASSSATVTGASFTDSSGTTTALPNSSVTLACGSSGTINDWAGVFEQTWACFPFEFGHATITLVVSGANTLTIVDEDPPGSGITKTYDATLIGSNAYAVSGFFIGGSGTYREDFNWTLRRNLSGFSQLSHFVYISGPGTGAEGVCVARGIRR